MKITTAVSLAGGLAVGYALGAAAARARFQQIKTAATDLARHPRVQQALFDLAGQAKSKAEHLPGPAAPLVNQAATRVQDRLTQPAATPTPPTPSTPTPAAPARVRPGFPAERNPQGTTTDPTVS